MFQRDAEYVDKILRITKLGNLPVEWPSKFDLIINLTTAKVLNLNAPPDTLSLADQMIE